MDSRILTAILVVVGVPAVLVGYIVLTERLVALFPAPRQGSGRPWLWLPPGLAPAMLLLFAFLVLPTIGTFFASLFNKTGKIFFGINNYAYFFSSGDTLV